MKTLLALLAASLLLSACAVYVPGSAVIVEPDGYGGGGGRGGFCPPGQAKKGNC